MRRARWRGIRRHGRGWQASVFVNGRRVVQAFPLETEPADMQEWRRLTRGKLALGLPHDSRKPSLCAIDLDRFPRRDDGGGYIYFIRSGDMVKIGRATDPRFRLTELQCGHPDRLVVVAVMPTDNPISDEAALHARFLEWRRRGEWFLMSQELSDEIARVIREYPSFEPKTTTDAQTEIARTFSPEIIRKIGRMRLAP